MVAGREGNVRICWCWCIANLCVVDKSLFIVFGMFVVISMMCCREGGVDLWFIGVVELVVVVASVDSWDASVVMNFLQRSVWLILVVSSSRRAVV